MATWMSILLYKRVLPSTSIVFIGERSLLLSKHRMLEANALGQPCRRDTTEIQRTSENRQLRAKKAPVICGVCVATASSLFFMEVLNKTNIQ